MNINRWIGIGVLFCLFFGLLLAGCKKDPVEPNDQGEALVLGTLKVEHGGEYQLGRLRSVTLASPLTGASYQWSVKEASGVERTLGERETQVYCFSSKGEYAGRLVVEGRAIDFRMRVVDEKVEYSPDLAHVYKYLPAPGQFVNKLPLFEAGDTQDTMNAKALAALRERTVITLGAFGGFIEMGFDHAIFNREGPDVMIYGNAFEGNAEPGIVWVGVDHNGNGRPDEGEWYELKGSEYDHPETLHSYWVEYRRDSTMEGETYKEYMPWIDSEGESGQVNKIVDWHKQCYWPNWLSDVDKLRFAFPRLRGNVEQTSGPNPTYKLPSFAWGYVDNLPNLEERGFDLSDAVDGEGKAVVLMGADFIRVHTALNQHNGLLGETGTEVGAVYELNKKD